MLSTYNREPNEANNFQLFFLLTETAAEHCTKYIIITLRTLILQRSEFFINRDNCWTLYQMYYYYLKNTDITKVWIHRKEKLTMKS